MPKNEAHIVRTRNKKFRVRYYAANDQILSVSEVLNTRNNAKKNIVATINLASGKRMTVVDATGKEKRRFLLDCTGEEYTV